MTIGFAWVRWPSATAWRPIATAAILACTSLAAISLLILGAGSTTGAGPSSGALAPSSLTTLPLSARGAVSAAIASGNPAYNVGAWGVNGLTATSRNSQLRTTFDRSGVTAGAGSSDVKLSLRSFDYGGSVHRTRDVLPRASANRVTYSRSGLTEWYVNGAFGVEQGFTIARAARSGAGATMSLTLGLSRGVRASRSSGDGAVVLRTARGAALRYGSLSASDASGRKLASRLSLRDRRIVLAVDTSGARFPVTVDPFIEQASAPQPSDEQGKGHFGFSVALSADGGTALVGAPADNGIAGAAWVFTRSGSIWTQQGPQLTLPEQDEGTGEACPETAAECKFGRSVALSSDGSTALIGASRANGGNGEAVVFTRVNGSWSQFGDALTAGSQAIGESAFGRSVAMSGDGDTALIGAPGDSGFAGAAWVFTRTSSGFAQQGSELASDQETGAGRFGRSVALSSDGDTALVGAPHDDHSAGAVWAFARAGSAWIDQSGKLTAGAEEVGAGLLGSDVSLDADGDTALVGARHDSDSSGAAWVFTRDLSAWTQQGPKLTAAGEQGEGQFGSSTALSASGNTALLGAPRDDTLLGAAWTFSRSGTSWTQQEVLRAGDGTGDGVKTAFGTDVALAGDGASALVGGKRAEQHVGSVWSFAGNIEPVPVPPAEPVVPPESSSSPGSSDVEPSVSGPLARAGVLASATSVLAPPKLALTANVIPLSGIVRVRLPGSSKFTLLIEGEQIPFGSIVDTRRGRVSVITADAHGTTQTMVFYEGEFKLTQRPNGMVTSALFGGDFSACRAVAGRGRRARSSATHKRPVRKLWAEGHGSYSTKGNYATGAVLGTRWLTEDLCRGTFIRVLTDRVAVTNLITGKRVVVTAGHSYLARAPRDRRH